MKAFYLILVVFLKSCFLFYSDGYIISSFHLVNGSSIHEGRVEVKVKEDSDEDDEDGVLSDNGWTIDSADWVCQELGYPNAIFAPGASRFGKGRYNVFILENERVELECKYPGGDDSEEYVPCIAGKVQTAGVTCNNGTTVQPRTTNNPGTQLTGRSTTPPLTGTGVDRVTASPTVSVNMGMGARSASKSIAVPVAVSVVGVIIVAVLAILLFMYFKRTRKTQSEMKQEPTNPESKFNNMSYSVHNIPNNEGPSYYEPNTITKGTVGTDDLIDNVLYKPADVVRRGPNEYELDQDSSQNPTQYGLIDNVLYKPAGNIRRDPNQHEPDQSSTNDTLHYGLIDNVLYKPVESTENTHNFRQLPNGYDLPSNDSEYASPDEQASRAGLHQDGELIDNILYKPADNQSIQTGHASRKYYEIKPELTPGDYAVADCPISDTTVPPGARYYDIEPQPAHSRTQTKVAGYDVVHDIDDDATELTTDGRNGQRFVVRPDDTSSMIHEYAVVDNDRDSASNMASTNDATTSAAAKQKPFPRYATVQKKLSS